MVSKRKLELVHLTVGAFTNCVPSLEAFLISVELIGG